MLEFIRDIYASFRQTSLERIKSPFLGAFVFSWIGFNWQMLAIIFFSKKEIEQRLEIVNKSFDISSYLFAPICTTALIVIILPQINKFITRIQDKPNSDTVELSLASKIRIAELQQSLAESEARKKLADKKEERYIEEGIHAIKKGHDKAKNTITEQEGEITKLLHINNELQGQLAKAESKFNVEQESKSQIQTELVIEKENNRTLGDQIINLTSELNKLEADLSSSKDTYDRTLSEYNKLKQKIDISESSIRNYQARYPSLIKPIVVNGPCILKFNNNAEVALDNLNDTLRMQKENDRKVNGANQPIDGL